MHDFQTFELRNIDPDDISGVLVKIERSFGFRFAHAELQNTRTFGELCDIILDKVPCENLGDCTTQQAFYKLREVIAETLFVDKKDIKPETNLRVLFPKHIRRKSIKAVGRQLGVKLKILRPKHWVTGALTIILVASFVGLFIFWKIGVPGVAFSIIGLAIAWRLGNEIQLVTVGQFAELLSREHYFKSRRISKQGNRSEIIQKVKDLFTVELGIEEQQLTRQATFD